MLTSLKLKHQPLIIQIDYTRVNTQGQNIPMQIDALEKEGCKLIFQEKVGESKTDRPELRKMIEQSLDYS